MSRPTSLTPNDATGDDAYAVTVTNTGSAPSDGSPITVTDELPQGLTLDAAGASGEDQLAASHQTAGRQLTCVFRTCTYSGVVNPGDTLTVDFPVDVGAAGSVTNVVRVAGGGAPDAAMETPTNISSEPAAFGISPGGATTSLSSTQAGAHPDVTTSIAFNTVTPGGSLAGDPKDTIDEFPRAFASDFVDTPACPAAAFHQAECPIGTQVGVVTLTLVGTVEGTLFEPLYNLAADPGEVAKIGFAAGRSGELLFEGSFTLRSSDYGADITFANADQSTVELDNVALTVWGVPAAHVHDPLRFDNATSEFGAASPLAPAPFISNPTLCSGERLQATFRTDSWEQPAQFVPFEMPFGPIVGCDRLGMQPALSAEVTSNSAYAPTGFDLLTSIPQTYGNPEGLASANLEREVVTLPEGMTVNPSSGAGLAACTPAQFAEEREQEFPAQQKGEGHGCPNESKLASVKISTPSLKEEAVGSVYLATPYDNPFPEPPAHPNGSLLALYLIARIPDRGVLIKTPGLVQANEVTGQLTTTFDDLPPLPFSAATFQFNQGANAPLVTPPTCGLFEVKAALTPYANPEQVLTPFIAPFPISANCPSGGAPPFNPQVVAGTSNNAAGAYSPLYLRISRNDGEQEITGFSTTLPPGLTGNLSGIPFCGEAEVQRAREQTGAEAETSPTCPAASQIGHTIAEAGVGTVLAQTPGRLYLGGPTLPEGPNQPGAPFSVVSVTSAKVGPFDLGTVVVHLPLNINPETAQVSIPSGAADQIPHIIKGIVIHLRTIRVYIDREKFMLNPTSCAPMGLSATVIGSGTDLSSPVGQVPVAVTDPFQAADCSSLKFEPKFAVSTSGKTSKALGASLRVSLTYPGNALGSDANIKQVKVELPKALPSRLTTLQKACTKEQFDSNPAGCPPASVIGHAKAVTPILPVPLEGPAYFVSNGGEAFPNLIIVLQGYGVTIDLVGDTFISKTGVTSSTFKAVPDQPVSSFELELPEGPFSALDANKNLCDLTKTVTTKKPVKVKVRGKTKTVTRKTTKTEPEPLVMPTEFVGQNGATIHQNTLVGVTGCPKASKTKHKKRGGRKK